MHLKHILVAREESKMELISLAIPTNFRPGPLSVNGMGSECFKVWRLVADASLLDCCHTDFKSARDS